MEKSRPFSHRRTRAISDSCAPTQPVKYPLQAFEPFPLDDLPDPLRAFVAETSGAIGCGPAMVVLPLLSALASERPRSLDRLHARIAAASENGSLPACHG